MFVIDINECVTIPWHRLNLFGCRLGINAPFRFRTLWCSCPIVLLRGRNGPNGAGLALAVLVADVLLAAAVWIAVDFVLG